jgi:DNA-binding transcriptional ArsR family regulator
MRRWPGGSGGAADQRVTLVERPQNASESAVVLMIAKTSKHAKLVAVRAPHHPDRDDLSLVSVLHALSDPTRLEIVLRLAPDRERSCGEFHGLGGVSLGTLSHHLRVLREAGLTSTRIDGKHRYVSLRRDDLEARFPGIVEPIIAAVRPRSQTRRDVGQAATR